MSFVWPWLLLTLAGVPLLVLAYRRLLARRARRQGELAALGLVADPDDGRGGRGRRLGRHVGPALQLAALAVLAVALARPEATVAEARREGTVVLAVDVSASMAATDVEPSRITAAQQAARAFVARQPSTIRIAVVAFGSTGLVVQRPTSDRAAVLAAIDRLRPSGGTALGLGLQTALGLAVGRPVRVPTGDATDATGDPLEPAGEDLGYHSSAAVVLLSDGENRSDPDPLEVARLASTAGVRVYPVGLGSPGGTVLEIDGFRVSTRLDEAQLRAVATTTGGTYYPAGDEAALASVYERIDPIWSVRAERREVTGLLAGLGAVLLLAGAALSFVRFGRVI